MAKASDNKFPKVILEERLSDGSDTSNPAADHRALFLGEDGKLHLRDSSGTVTDVDTTGGGGATFKQTVRAGAGNYTTTSTTRTPIDSTNLGYLTFDLAVGDVVRCVLRGQVKSSADGFPVSFDVEVDQPTSANVYIGAGHDYGLPGAHWSATRGPCNAQGQFVATEAGTHGFRPVWFVESTATATLANASSGGDDIPIYFIVEKLGAPA